MKGRDEVIEVAKRVKAMAEVIAQKPVGDRNIRMTKHAAEMIERNGDVSHVAELREFLRLNEIRIHQVD